MALLKFVYQHPSRLQWLKGVRSPSVTFGNHRNFFCHCVSIKPERYLRGGFFRDGENYVRASDLSLVVSHPSFMLLFKLDSFKFCDVQIPLLSVEVELVHFFLENFYRGNSVEVHHLIMARGRAS